jgi:CRISPR-associated endoribonuclease Cas6
MPVSVVIQLRALKTGSMLNGTGIHLHGALLSGFLRSHLPEYGDQLHPAQMNPYTISPLFGLPEPEKLNIGGTPAIVCRNKSTCKQVELAVHRFSGGQEAWFRVTALDENGTVRLDTSRWQVTRIFTDQAQHPDARAETYSDMLMAVQAVKPIYHFQFQFISATTFAGKNFNHPFPEPANLISSWMNRWNAFSGYPMPADLPELARTRLAVESFDLQTRSVRTHNGKDTVGFFGSLALRGHKLTPELSRNFQLLADYAFYCGTGYLTGMGFGQTLPGKNDISSLVGNRKIV